MIKHLLVLTIAATFASAAQAQSTFRDVPDNHWAAAAVKRLAEAGIIEGRGAVSSADVTSNEDNALNTIVSTSQITSALSNNPSLERQKINVVVTAPARKQRGIVTLTGAVRNQAQQTIAASIARREAPYYTIVNRLKVVAARSTRKR